MDNRVSFIRNNPVINVSNNIRRRSAFNNIMKNHRLQQEKSQKIIAIVLICIIVFIIVSLLVYFLLYKKYYNKVTENNDENKQENQVKVPKCVEACNMCKRRKYTNCEKLCESCKQKLSNNKK